VIPYDSPCEESVYRSEMAKMHKLSPKLDVIRRLRAEMAGLQTDSGYVPDVKGEQREWLILHLSAQIFALALELTDDLAAVCKSYMDAVREKDTNVIERIAKFGHGEGHEFYKEASSNAQYAADALGLDASDPNAKEWARINFERIHEARKLWWKWYTGYKHAQYATPVALTRTDTSEKKWGLYLIQKTAEKPEAGKVHTRDLFIDTVMYSDEFIKMAELCVSLWSQTVSAQLPKVFKIP